MNTEHFVTFESPGTFYSENTTKPIASWSIDEAVAMANSITERYGARPFAFYFTTVEHPDAKEIDGKTYLPKDEKPITTKSGRYFLGGDIMTLADVERDMPEERILISNMGSGSVRMTPI